MQRCLKISFVAWTTKVFCWHPSLDIFITRQCSVSCRGVLYKNLAAFDKLMVCLCILVIPVESVLEADRDDSFQQFLDQMYDERNRRVLSVLNSQFKFKEHLQVRPACVVTKTWQRVCSGSSVARPCIARRPTFYDKLGGGWQYPLRNNALKFWIWLRYANSQTAPGDYSILHLRLEAFPGFLRENYAETATGMKKTQKSNNVKARSPNNCPHVTTK